MWLDRSKSIQCSETLDAEASRSTCFRQLLRGSDECDPTAIVSCYCLQRNLSFPDDSLGSRQQVDAIVCGRTQEWRLQRLWPHKTIDGPRASPRPTSWVPNMYGVYSISGTDTVWAYILWTLFAISWNMSNM